MLTATRLKRHTIAFCAGACLSFPAQATDSFYSELGHFAGGVFWGSAATYATDRYWPQFTENRVVIGVSVAAIAGILGEVHDSMYGHPRKFSVLDAGSTILGGIVGATATDRWILTPTVRSEHGVRYYGLASQYRF